MAWRGAGVIRRVVWTLIERVGRIEVRGGCGQACYAKTNANVFPGFAHVCRIDLQARKVVETSNPIASTFMLSGVYSGNRLSVTSPAASISSRVMRPAPGMILTYAKNEKMHKPLRYHDAYGGWGKSDPVGITLAQHLSPSAIRIPSPGPFLL